MGFEARGKRRYYYRKQRVGDRVISEYVGREEVAAAIASLDAREREHRQTEGSAEAVRRAELTAADRAVDEVSTLIRSLTRAVLLANGFHQHHRQWRRQRGSSR